MDVKLLREQCDTYLKGVDWPIDNDVPRALLRILDASEAMEREGWTLTRMLCVNEADNHWAIISKNKAIARGPSPLAALLAAADTLKEDKSDG